MGSWERVGRLARTALAAVGLGTVTVVVGGTLVVRKLSKTRITLQPDLKLPEEGFVLEMDLEGISLLEKQDGGLKALLSKGHPKLELHRAIKALRAAADDQRVKGVLAFVGTLGDEAGLAQIQELRQAVLAFRQKTGGRAASVAYADSFGEGGAFGTGPYYLASAFEQVYLMPSGLLSFTGLAASQPFVRGLLDRLKIRPLVFRREEFKSALSFMTGSGFTEPEREAMTSLLQDLSAQIVGDVAAARRLTSAAVQKAVDTAPLTSDQALQLRLIDGALYRDQAAKVVVRLAALKAAQQQAAMAAHMAALTAEPQRDTAAAGASATGGEQQAGEGKVVAPAAEGGKGSQRVAMADDGQAAAALLKEPDTTAQQRLPRVPLQHYLKVVEAQEREQQKDKQLNTLQQVIKELNELKEEARSGEAERADPEAMLERQLGILKELQTPTVALFTLTGPIVLGRGDNSPAGAGGQSGQVASLPVIKALEKAAATPAVKAVVLRIDSPGGSAAASDAIHREVSRLRALGKPVVISMGNVAASGGYFISCAANKVVAQPATLTGSIGVISGKVVVGDFLRESLDVNTETIKTGKNADAASPYNAFTPEQEAQGDAMVESVYRTFLQRVAAGRGMPVEAVREVARGRVWTGQQALVRGLVDAMGGLEDAIRLAKAEAQLPVEEGVVQVREFYPEPRSPVGRLLDLFRGREAPAANLEALVATYLGLLIGGGAGQQPVGATALPGLLLAPGARQQQQLPRGLGLEPQMYSAEAQRLLASMRL